MKFEDLVKKKFESLLEQTPGAVPEVIMPAQDPVVAQQLQAQPTPAPAPAPEEQSTTKPLTPEGEVFLINLLRKALFMNPDDLELKSIKDLPDTNEKNASDVLDRIVKIMQIDSINLDVNTSK